MWFCLVWDKSRCIVCLVYVCARSYFEKYSTQLAKRMHTCMCKYMRINKQRHACRKWHCKINQSVLHNLTFKAIFSGFTALNYFASCSRLLNSNLQGAKTQPTSQSDHFARTRTCKHICAYITEDRPHCTAHSSKCPLSCSCKYKHTCLFYILVLLPHASLTAECVRLPVACLHQLEITQRSAPR